MKLPLLITCLFLSLKMNAQNKTNHLTPLWFGSIQPSGWLKEQMQQDIHGFVGHLDQLVPDLITDPIYGSGRLQKHSKPKDLGNLKSGDAEGEDQYKWWNSETQSNWWDAYIRNVILINDKAGIDKVKQYVQGILLTQDKDGYLGIYDKDLRYHFDSENGELWSKTTLYRGLLAYYEYSKNASVMDALRKAVDNVMTNYPINASSPFSSGNSFNGGVSHGLTFTDILDRMYFHTGDKKYSEYALFLYRDFSKTHQSESDAQLKNILDTKYRLKSHGVHTFEHLRPLTVAAFSANDDTLQEALYVYLKRIDSSTTITGGAIGDEWIANRKADATYTGYEYCSLQELLDSYGVLLQKTGEAVYGDAIENIFYNAAQGARNPNHSCIAYLKTDNSYEMMGTKNGEVEVDRKQTRYKYSPAHQDVAVCCSPNAGRISPYFIQHAWMKENTTTLVATLLMPNILETNIGETNIRIENKTNYPNDFAFNFLIRTNKPTLFTLKIRKPDWVKSVVTNEKFTEQDQYITITRIFNQSDAVTISFDANIKIKSDNKGDKYYSYGPLIFARPIGYTEIKGREYGEGLADYTYQPTSSGAYLFTPTKKISYKKGVISTELINPDTHQIEKVNLVPMGKTILRQVTFK